MYTVEESLQEDTVLGVFSSSLVEKFRLVFE